MIIWEGYEEVEIEVLLLKKGKLAYSEYSWTYIFTRTCLAGLKEVFCATTIV